MGSSLLPVIGISGSLLTIESGALRGRERAFVGQDYIQAISRAGGIPIILPIVNEEESIIKHLGLIDGLILSGGYDVHPHYFGEEPHALLDACYPDRDEYEIKLARLTRQSRKPILGICRGLQLMNVAFGGSLYQDLTLYSSNTLQHNQKVRIDHAIHTVAIKEGTFLRKLINLPSLSQTVCIINPFNPWLRDLTINAIAEDGIIEGIEKMDESFILGIQVASGAHV